MATVINENQVYLNGTLYSISGKVEKTLLTKSPLKHWSIGDQSGGIGCLELREAKDLKKAWWSTCDLDHGGHLIPPSLASTASRYSTQVSPTGFTETGWSNAANAYDGNTGTKASSGAIALNDWSTFLTLTRAATACKGVRVWAVMQVDPAAAHLIDIDIYYDAGWQHVYNGVFTPSCWITYGFGATRTITQIRFAFKNVSGAGQAADVFEVALLTTTADSDAHTAVCWANYNSQAYLAVNTKLYKLDSASGDAWLVLKDNFASNITDLKVGVDNDLAILQGDAVAFWYMTTTEVLTQTDEIGAYYGVYWDNKFCWIKSDGTQLSYCTTFAAVLAETDNGVIGQKCTVQGLDVYQDAAGTPIIYARTDIGVFSHDTGNGGATGKFYKTQLELAQHSSTAKAGLNWNTAYYVSQGIHVKKYMVGNYNATTTPVGLDADDGLPFEYDSHIVSFIPDINFMYVLYNSPSVNATGYSWVGKFNGTSWQCLWLAGTVNWAMHSGIVSSVFARRLWFDCGDTIYYIPLSTTLLFPKLVTTSTYAASAIHITPWFDADVSTFNRIATEVSTFCKSISTTEKVYVAYRLNRTYTDIATDWTTILSLDTTGENNRVSTSLASGAGLAFNAIQFKITFTNTGASTATGDLQGLDLTYFDTIDSKYGFRFTVPLGEGFSGNEPAQVEAGLKTAAESATLLEFTYRNKSDTTETYYVKLQPFSGKTATGDNFAGEYIIELIEP